MKQNSASMTSLPFNYTPSMGYVPSFLVKNVMEVQDAPKQLLLGAKHLDFCILTVVGAWLGINFDVQTEGNEFHFGLKGYNNPTSIKSCYFDAVKFTIEFVRFLPTKG